MESSTQAGLTTGSPRLKDLLHYRNRNSLEFSRIKENTFHLKCKTKRDHQPHILDFALRKITAYYMSDTMPWKIIFKVPSIPQHITSKFLKKNYASINKLLRSNQSFWPPEWKIKEKKISYDSNSCSKIRSEHCLQNIANFTGENQTI